jgi:hypothetical protein
MSNKPRKVFARMRGTMSFALAGDASAFADVMVRKPAKPLSKEYLDALQADIDAQLGPASKRKPVSQSGW